MSKYYAGIGSRGRTPSFIFDMMSSVASKLESIDYILRSGGAQGADTAFENGVIYNNNKEIFRPKHATTEAIELASRFHPTWDACSPIARKLHGRNSMIILGSDLNSPVKFVICYTHDGSDSGGTGLGIRIAQNFNIPVFNLFHTDIRDRLDKFIGINREQFDGL
jgi:hypothetical protein